MDQWLSLSDDYMYVDFGKTRQFSEKALKAAVEEKILKEKQCPIIMTRSLVFFRNFDEGAEYLERASGKGFRKIRY
jgi:hypothetical protein